MKCFDLQVNGAFGVDFSSDELSEESFLRCTEQILNHGVTRFLPTVITSPAERYRKNLALINRTIDRHGLSREVPGFHLEGPFISPMPGAVGAHTPCFVQEPTPEGVRKLNDFAEGRIKLMTFAADRPGAPEAIREAHLLGIQVSLGHHLATPEDLRRAGGDALTHLGNGAPNRLDRHRNPIWSGLADDSLTAMVIADGHHLPTEVLKCIIRCKGVKNLIVTSDSSSAAGLPPGKYLVLGNQAVLHPDGRLENPKKHCLVGSSSLLPDCIRFLRENNLLTEPDLEQAVWENPHRLLRIPPMK